MLYPKKTLEKAVLGLFLTAAIFVPLATADELDQKAEFQSNLGAYYWQKGKYGSAIAAWQKELELSQSIPEKAIATLKIAEARINLGQSRLAVLELEEFIGGVKLEDEDLLSRLQNQLGNAFYLDKDLEDAVVWYSKSIDTKKNLSALNNLALTTHQQANYALLRADNSREEFSRVYRELEERYSQEAVEYALSALSFSKDKVSPSSLKALMQWQKLSLEKLTPTQLQRGRKILASLPVSLETVFLTIEWSEVDSEQREFWQKRALLDSQSVENASVRSYVLLEMGLEAEKNQKYAEALNLAYQARRLAQLEFAEDSLYRSFWLTGRIYSQLGERDLAIENYRNAIASGDIDRENTPQFDLKRRLEFSENIEPIYREMLELLLVKPNQSELKEAISIFDKLRLGQLQKYFGDDCVEIDSKTLTVEESLVSINAAAVYSVILQEKTHFILQTKNGIYHHSEVEAGSAEITAMATEWYLNISQGNSQKYRDGSRYFYDAIILPFEQQLEKFAPSLIVFIHDGILRNVPMAALMDKDDVFLAQKLPSISSLGLNFSLKKNKSLKVAAFGLETTELEGWSRLYRVVEEVDRVVDIVGGTKFTGENFTTNSLQKQLNKNYSVLHLATHGYFGGIAENSFILAYDEPINALKLEELFISSDAPIDLLVMSACETAIGNELSALGLAGVALRNGIGSVMGTFWSVQDEQQVRFIESFYRQVVSPQPIDLASAVQKVQMESIAENVDPAIWAAANLIGY